MTRHWNWRLHSWSVAVLRACDQALELTAPQLICCNSEGLWPGTGTWGSTEMADFLFSSASLIFPRALRHGVRWFVSKFTQFVLFTAGNRLYKLRVADVSCVWYWRVSYTCELHVWATRVTDKTAIKEAGRARKMALQEGGVIFYTKVAYRSTLGK